MEPEKTIIVTVVDGSGVTIPERAEVMIESEIEIETGKP